MRKSIFMVMLALLLAVPAFAAGTPNKAPVKELIVASDGEYTTITAALASLPDPNTTPVVIKVMPGTYTESIQMKDNVNLIGSGQESTKITSADVVTIYGANNAAVENIWVENTSTGTTSHSAIKNNDTSLRINNVKITFLSSPAINIASYGIDNNGANSKSVITNCNISNTNAVGSEGGNAVGIYISGGASAAISNCTIELDNITDWNSGIASWDGNSVIRNTVIKVTGAKWNRGIEGGAGVTVSNSRVEAIGTSNTLANQNRPLRNFMTVVNSEIIATGNGTPYGTVDNGQDIGGSLITGGITSSHVVNCWDENFHPIPNYPW